MVSVMQEHRRLAYQNVLMKGKMAIAAPFNNNDAATWRRHLSDIQEIQDRLTQIHSTGIDMTDHFAGLQHIKSQYEQHLATWFPLDPTHPHTT